VRALEQRIAHADEAARKAAKETNADKRPGNFSPLIQVNITPGVPPLFADHAKLMMDLIVLAFQSDTTRIVTFMFGNAGQTASSRARRDRLPSPDHAPWQ
jgi:hypothetical protein